LAAWTRLVTNVPAARLPVHEALVLGRARGQIELLFKKYALHIASAFGRLTALVTAITTVKRCLAVGCRMNRRKKHPNT
jgi:hypothetical protein